MMRCGASRVLCALVCSGGLAPVHAAQGAPVPAAWIVRGLQAREAQLLSWSAEVAVVTEQLAFYSLPGQGPQQPQLPPREYSVCRCTIVGQRVWHEQAVLRGEGRPNDELRFSWTTNDGHTRRVTAYGRDGYAVHVADATVGYLAELEPSIFLGLAPGTLSGRYAALAQRAQHDAVTEVMRGEPAARLEVDGTQTLWVLPERGCAPLRYETVSKAKGGATRGSVEYADWFEPAPGLWLPRHAASVSAILVRASTQDTEGRWAVTFRQYSEVSNVILGPPQPAEDWFLHVPVGAVVYDHRTGQESRQAFDLYRFRDEFQWAGGPPWLMKRSKARAAR